jgi:hypothetical protein
MIDNLQSSEAVARVSLSESSCIFRPLLNDNPVARTVGTPTLAQGAQFILA